MCGQRSLKRNKHSVKEVLIYERDWSARDLGGEEDIKVRLHRARTQRYSWFSASASQIL